MKTFINRHEELGFLEKEYERNGSSLIVLYGRRRVGKTALITEFMKNKKAIYFLATEENEAQNRLAFKNIVAEQTGNELLLNASVNNWDPVFKAWLDPDIPEKN